MRRAIVAALCLGLLAVVSAGDISAPKPLTGRLSCLLPISRLQCSRDWRSGFVNGIKYGYNEFTTLGPDSTSGTAVENWMQVCGAFGGNVTTYDMSVESSIQSSLTNGAPWYTTGTEVDDYLYPSGAPITQVIVIKAPNPFGDKFGTIAAVLFGYLTGQDESIEWAVCGNALYAHAYLNPGDRPQPPTIGTLKATYTSGISDDSELVTALGGFDGKCAVRGSGFLGGDPNTSAKYFIKSLAKPCFVPANVTIFPVTVLPPTAPDREPSDFNCTNVAIESQDPRCFRRCHFDKKHNKKSPSYSCVMNGLAIHTGKHSAIDVDPHGNMYEYQPDAYGKMQRVKGATFYEGEPDEKDHA